MTFRDLLSDVSPDPSSTMPMQSRDVRVLISGTLASGGVGTQIAILCRLLLSRGARVSCCATHCQWSAEEVENLTATGVNVHLSTLGGWGALLAWPFTMSRNFDVLYCIGHGRCHALAKRFLRPGGLAVYHEVLGCPAAGSVAGRNMPIMDALVANSKVVGREMQARWPGKPLRVIPFLTAEGAVAVPPPRPSIGDRELHVVYLGRLVEYKGAPRLIREWASLSRCSPLAPARLDIHGNDLDPATLPRLGRLIEECRIQDRVRCHGPYKHGDLPKILAEADLVVLPSEWEGLPLVLVEAMQYGVPIVATNVGGNSELGEANRDAIITEPAWAPFIHGLMRMAAKLRSGEIDAQRLHHWTEQRYGYATVAEQWCGALLDSRNYFSNRLCGPSR